MTMKLSDAFNEAKMNWVNAVTSNEPIEKQNEMFNGMINQIFEEVKIQAQKAAEEFAAQNEAELKMDAKARKFFNEIKTEVGYKEEILLPQTTIDQIFEDLVTEHPLLSAIGLKNAGLRLKFLRSETSGVAVWGKIFGEIKGQLDAEFSQEEAIDNKLTAFVVLPKDLKDFGPAWIESFIRTQIQETFATALELAFLTGDGKDKPVGLNRKVAEGTSVTDGVYPEKETKGKLTFADSKTTVKELTEVHKYHSVKENDEPLNVDGKVVLVVNPTNSWDVKRQYTSLNAAGVYVSALPFNINLIESIAQPAGKALSFIPERYDAYLAGGVAIKKYDQTLAIEDLDLYTAKQFAFGKAKDDKAAAVWELDTESPKA